jgi:hypothetical protein
MFLMVKGAKGGLIKGEALDAAHKGEIDVLSWSWGMHSRPALGGGGATGKAAVHELKIVKRVDSASTAPGRAPTHQRDDVKVAPRRALKGCWALQGHDRQGRVTSLTTRL